MRKRNLYKDIVFLAAGCLCMLGLIQGVGFWLRQQKSCELIIQSETDLTEELVAQIGKMEGVFAFFPCASCKIRLRLDEYSMETSAVGVDLEEFPFQWEALQEEHVLGSTPVLFVGQEVFSAFTDDHGNGAGAGRIAQWKENYAGLELVAADESGRERSARIGGILKEPAAGIYMSGTQMQELYASSAKTTGGCLKIRGERNRDRAKELLGEAGFLAE